MKAQHAGWCKGCLAAILPGDEIRRSRYGNGWMHAPCTETEMVIGDQPEPPRLGGGL